MNLSPIEQTRLELLQQGKKIINLSSGSTEESGMAFPAAILQKGYEKFLQNRIYRPDPKGDLEARKAVAEFYAERHWKIDADHILLTSGTSESYFEIFKLLAKPGEEILFPNPSYPLFDHIAGLAEIKLAFYQLDENDGWQINLDHLASKITPGTRAIVLISPSNPTGAVLSEKTLQGVIEIARQHHLAIISDEVFSEFIFDGHDYPRVAAMAPDLTVFTLNGVSKTYALPGLKISWIAVSGPDTAQIVDKLELLTDTFLACNQISQMLLPDIIRGGEPFIREYRKYLEGNRDLTTRILSESPAISFHKPAGGFYLFAKINSCKLTDEELTIRLLKQQNLFVHPGYFYNYEIGVYLLISFLMRPELLEKALYALTPGLSAL